MTEKKHKDTFRGIDYIRLSQLPDDQKDQLQAWITKDQVIKIMIDKKIMPDCIQYRHYEEWYTNVFPIASNSEIKEPVSEKPGVYNLSYQK